MAWSPFIRPAPDRTVKIFSTLAVAVFLPLLLVVVYQSVKLASKAALSQKAAIVVDVNARGGLVSMDFIRAFSQGGEESSDMIAPIVPETKALTPKTIRIDHIYDHFGVGNRGANGLNYTWGKLDQAIQTIRATGATPMIVLSYMPQAIAKDGNVINPPNNWNEWSDVVKATVERYSGRSGLNITGVMYEVWNEPDLGSFGSWKTYGDKNYLTLYQYAVSGASRAQNVNSFQIGGPATTGLYESWIKALAGSSMRVDFFSWHSYLADPAKFRSDDLSFRKIISNYPNRSSTPYMITEFGFTGDKSPLYSTNYSAAHAAASIRQMIDGAPKYLYTFQLKDGPNETGNSGWGLIQHESKGKGVKPRYGIFSLLNKMDGTRLTLSGEGDWVTGFATTKDATYRIMLVNFDPEGKHVESVPVTIKNLPKGTYLYKESRTGAGSTQRTIIQDSSGFAGSTFQTTITIPVNSVVVVEMTKQS